jgi:CRP-like cAMP-binding protein
LARAARAAQITNQLLDRLTERDRSRVLAECEQVDLVLHEPLAEPGSTIRNVYFPLDSFVSLLTPMGGKDILEVALAGNEGMYGAPVALGVDVSPLQALVQGGGSAWQMDTVAFRRELVRTPALRQCVDRYLYVLMTQLTRTAGCNRFHVVEQRVARWLLMTADRAHTPSFHITHEFLAHMLGVRRVGITKAAGALQSRKLIRYSRGNVTILDRKGLERASCACYRSDLATYDRILSNQAA